MILVDALYINISGGKILLDYIIEEFNKADIEVFYLFDLRMKNRHPDVNKNRFSYLRSGILQRHKFYLNNWHKFSKVLCFANLPPTIKLPGTVFTYFHQPLFISIHKEIPISQRAKLMVKTFILSRLVNNTDYWLVQSEFMKDSLMRKFNLEDKSHSVKILPFYPGISSDDETIERRKQLVYISNGEAHKNHVRLLEAYTQFYDSHKLYELHLTVEKKFEALYELIAGLQKKGYPIINHEYLNRRELSQLYRSSEYLIYPSLAESFGLGIIEALESGCKVIGADLPYMHAVCVPSLLFNPESVDNMIVSLKKIILEDIKPSKQLVFNQVEKLISLFKL